MILHKLAQFHYQIVFTFQVIQYVFRVSCLGIWWRHDIWISKTLKVDYLKNEKSFWGEAFFLVSQVLSFRHTKQTSKNVAGTTFNFTPVLQSNITFWRYYLKPLYWLFLSMVNGGEENFRVLNRSCPVNFRKLHKNKN